MKRSRDDCALAMRIILPLNDTMVIRIIVVVVIFQVG